MRAERVERVELKAAGAEAGLAREEEILVAAWSAKAGDSISEGQPLVELVTDKAAFEVPAPVTGELVEIRAENGARVRPADVLAIIETEAK